MSAVLASAGLIARAQEIYRSASENFRDSMLELGRVLRDYVIARAKEATGLTRKYRCKLRLTREAFIEQAAQDLRMRPWAVNELIKTAAAFDLLVPPGTDLGTISYSSLRPMGALARRPAEPIRIDRDLEEGHLELADKEVWKVNPDVGEEKARALYAQCLRERWTYATSLKKMKSYFRKERKGRPPKGVSTIARTERPQKDAMDVMTAISHKASARDLADLILRMIEESPDPEAVRRALLDGGLLEKKSRRLVDAL